MMMSYACRRIAEAVKGKTRMINPTKKERKEILKFRKDKRYYTGAWS